MSPSESSRELIPASLRHLPLVREAIDQIGIFQTLERLFSTDPRSLVSDADCVALMILNILHGRVALYKMSDWLEATDVEVVLGKNCPSTAFTDDRLAMTLDHLFEFGTDDVLSEVVRSYFADRPGPSSYSVLTDTTTIKLYGDYERDLVEGEPQPNNGHSKDFRPDLKQLVYGLSLHGAVGIPLCVSVLDGNTSDHVANRWHIDELAGLLPPQDDVTLVADCKFFDPITLGRALDANFHFVTLVPRTYKLRREIIQEVLERETSLPVLERSRGRLLTDPDKVYSGISTLRPFCVFDPETQKPKDVPLQFLAVSSSELGSAFENSLPDRLAKEKVGMEKACKRLELREFACEPDAKSALEDFLKQKRLYTTDFSVFEESYLAARSRRGRPKTGEKQPVRTCWRIGHGDLRVNEVAVEEERRIASFFVLATDNLSWEDDRILQEYRHQRVIEGHTGFRWLKGPAAAAPMFLKTPARMAALGVVFVLALMVRNYIQYTVREKLAENNETLPNMNKQPTKTPTTENLFEYFLAVAVVIEKENGLVIHRHVHGLSVTARRVLTLLDMDPSIFSRPRKSGLPCEGSSE